MRHKTVGTSGFLARMWPFSAYPHQAGLRRRRSNASRSQPVSKPVVPASTDQPQPGLRLPSPDLTALQSPRQSCSRIGTEEFASMLEVLGRDLSPGRYAETRLRQHQRCLYAILECMAKHLKQPWSESECQQFIEQQLVQPLLTSQLSEICWQKRWCIITCRDRRGVERQQKIHIVGFHDLDTTLVSLKSVLKWLNNLFKHCPERLDEFLCEWVGEQSLSRPLDEMGDRAFWQQWFTQAMSIPPILKRLGSSAQPSAMSLSAWLGKDINTLCCNFAALGCSVPLLRQNQVLLDAWKIGEEQRPVTAEVKTLFLSELSVRDKEVVYCSALADMPGLPAKLLNRLAPASQILLLRYYHGQIRPFGRYRKDPSLYVATQWYDLVVPFMLSAEQFDKTLSKLANLDRNEFFRISHLLAHADRNNVQLVNNLRSIVLPQSYDILAANIHAMRQQRLVS